MQRARYTDIALRKGTHTQNKDILKKQSETAEEEVNLHREFNKGTEFSQNCNSECGQLAELLAVTEMATVPLLRVANMYSFQATVQVGEYTNHRESATTHCK